MANTYLDMQLDSASTWGSPYTAEEFTARVEAGEDVMGLDNSTLSGITKMIEIGGTDHDPRAVLNELKVGNDAPLREIGSAIQESGRSGAAVTYEVGAAVHTGWIAENLYRMDQKIENGQGGQYDQFCQIGNAEQAKDVKIMLPILDASGVDARGWESVAARAEPEPVSSFVGKVAALAPEYKNYAPEQVTAFASHHGVDPETVMNDTDKDERGLLANNVKDDAMLDNVVRVVDAEDVRENVQEYLQIADGSTDVDRLIEEMAGDPEKIESIVDELIGIGIDNLAESIQDLANMETETHDTVDSKAIMDKHDEDKVESSKEDVEKDDEDEEDLITGSVD